MMTYKNLIWDDLSINIRYSSFDTNNAISEHHAMIELSNTTLDASQQFANIELAVQRLCKELQNTTLVLKRYFVSDATNQCLWIEKQNANVAISIVQQPPMNGTKVAIWVYLVTTDDSKIYTDPLGTIVLDRPSYKHLYSTQLQSSIKTEYAQTEYIFDIYCKSLAAQHCTLKDNCIRTWIYVQGVDIHYSDMVKARTHCFDQQGLTTHTHYIASTGIEGRHADPQSLVLMDAYAVKGIQPEQIKYLLAPSHLNKTHEYGVTFERGTSIDYADRRHVYISGTASINSHGEVVYAGDVLKQIERTIENITMLLGEADSAMGDVAKMIVYIRDTADYGVVDGYLKQYYPQIPTVILWAPVCRPGWLVEVECIAIKAIEANAFAKY